MTVRIGGKKTLKHRIFSLLFLISLLLSVSDLISQSGSDKKTATATFAGGCFWCMEPPFDKTKGVLSTTSGYTGGRTINPGYKEVSSGSTGHAEAIQVEYDPNLVSYEKLLEVFWRNIDPTVENKQFCDHGDQYRSEIFVHSEDQKKLANQSLEKVRKKFKKVYTRITDFKVFYPAEEYHQDYYMKNPVRYKYYRFSCGRDQRLDELWGKDREKNH
ncbi:MAG: peptide-methionine (S)-S-oxide reductase MsrA [Leptospiraceae bacterium]|nr:peptide-methionine (S)-S-oxide reductase MsrA [Leptospiraceae bacterium]